MEPINCAEACVNGCILGDQCPNRVNLEATSKFIQENSLDAILRIADSAIRRKMTPPDDQDGQPVLPEEKN